MTTHEPSDLPDRKTARETAHAYRARMRAKGYKPVTFWVPDVDSPEFKEQARRDSLAIKNSRYEKEDQEFIESISIWNDDEKR